MYSPGAAQHGLIFLPIILFIYGAMDQEKKHKYFGWASLVIFVYCLVGQRTTAAIMEMLGDNGGYIFMGVLFFLSVIFFRQHFALRKSQVDETDT